MTPKEQAEIEAAFKECPDSVKALLVKAIAHIHDHGNYYAGLNIIARLAGVNPVTRFGVKIDKETFNKMMDEMRRQRNPQVRVDAVSPVRFIMPSKDAGTKGVSQ